MIQELELQFDGTGEVKDFVFTQVYKSDKAYIYEVNTGTKHYEVFKRKHSPICLDFDNRIYSTTEFKETYPKSKDFGIWAWTYKNLDNALEKFQILNNN